MKSAFVIALLVALAAAQDPAPGWLAYATATCPAGERITHMEAKWKVGQTPPSSFAFFSPWFGIDTTDNLNLLQPVNPWEGSGWAFYTEYYQWSPSNNVNSHQYSTEAGNVLHGQLTFNGESKQSYTLIQQDLTANQKSSMVIPVQRDESGQHKNYSVMYIVYEKVAQCAHYPPDQKVEFYDIFVYCNGQKVNPKWTTSYVEDVCDFRAHVINTETVTITWNINAANPRLEQMKQNRRGHLQKPHKKEQ